MVVIFSLCKSKVLNEKIYLKMNEINNTNDDKAFGYTMIIYMNEINV